MGNLRDEIAKNMLFYRKRAGLTQKELADQLGVRNTAVSNWEMGNNSVDIETLFAAAKIFGVSLSEMYGKYGESSSASLVPEEQELLDAFRSMNDEGKAAALAAVRGLAASGLYQIG